MRCLRTVFASAFILVAAACSRQKPAPAATDSAKTTIIYASSGWSSAERSEYYHLAEGSELMPYALVANLISAKTQAPFLEHIERFGFIPDDSGPNNPRGLPIGLTINLSRNAKTRGIETVGFNCAACHVGEITYRGKRMRIDGAPSLVNLQAYQVEFKESLDATLKNPRKLLALVVAIDRERHAPDTPPVEALGRYADDPSVKTAGEVPDARTADPSFHAVSSQMADASDPLEPVRKQGFPQRLKSTVAFLKARLAYVKHGKLLLDGTEPGPGRVDAFGAARNLLFPEYAMKMQSPVSYPYIWGVPDTTQQRSARDAVYWIHYDGNTNSILERNIGQALGMGAVFDPKTFESTLRIGNLHRLEVLTHKLQPPKWPVEMLGPIDETKARAGEEIFRDKCQVCHQGRLIALTEVGTDPNRANSFGQPVGKTPFPQAVAPILTGLKRRAFEDDGIGKAEQSGMDADPVIWRATGKYMARELKGIWATAPYLHNGSVPTLYHLLYPEQRPAKFAVGNREYDPAKIGYSSEIPTAPNSFWIYDTTEPGNSNMGHAGERFGTELSADQKANLLEYLKSL